MYYGSFADGCGMGMMWRPCLPVPAGIPMPTAHGRGTRVRAIRGFRRIRGDGCPITPAPGPCAPGVGWGWLPGGNWNGLNNYAMVPGRAVAAAVPPGDRSIRFAIRDLRSCPGPPRRWQWADLAGGQRSADRQVRNDFFELVIEFRKDSAGLGVPRDAFGNLQKYSQHVEAHGTVNEHVYFSAPAGTMAGGRAGSTAVMAGSIHRGASPPSGSYTGGASSTASSGRMGGSSPSYSNSSSSSSSHSSAPSSSSSSGGSCNCH